MSLDLDTRRKRLRFRSWHRGWKEHDLLIGSFADAHVAQLEAEQVGHLEALLDEDDTTIDDWLNDRCPVPAAHDTDVLAMLRAHRARGLA